MPPSPSGEHECGRSPPMLPRPALAFQTYHSLAIKYAPSPRRHLSLLITLPPYISPPNLNCFPKSITSNIPTGHFQTPSKVLSPTHPYQIPTPKTSVSEISAPQLLPRRVPKVHPKYHHDNMLAGLLSTTSPILLPSKRSRTEENRTEQDRIGQNGTQAQTHAHKTRTQP